MKQLITIILLAFAGITGAYAQIGIGTTTPNSSAALDVSSTNKGLLIPRMSSTQRTGISSPAKGLIVFDNDSSYFFYYSGSAWQALKNSAFAAANGIKISGTTISLGGNLTGATTIGTSSTNT